MKNRNFISCCIVGAPCERQVIFSIKAPWADYHFFCSISPTVRDTATSVNDHLAIALGMAMLDAYSSDEGACLAFPLPSGRIASVVGSEAEYLAEIIS